MSKVYKSEIMASVHEMVEGFHHNGSIDKRTMREFDGKRVVNLSITHKFGLC